jgi:Ca2+-transporting ATPase
MRLAKQFNELVVWIPVAAAVVSGFLQDWVETVVILSIVLLNGLIGFLQEERAGRALLALQSLARPRAKVIRQGHLSVVPAPELVPGDLLSLEAGDHVPADARLVHATSLRVHEAPLTGESVPIDKVAHATHAQETPLADRANMIYMGTAVVAGSARAVVVATGAKTELGHIAGLLQRQQPEPTPLQRRLAELGRVLIVVCLALVALVFLLNVLRGGDLATVFLIAVSLAVAAVPEGLPAVVTIALALGLQRMIRRHALIRRLPSVETLGSVTVICSDKTGTLTRNEMTVREIATASGTYDVTGAGYAAAGKFTFRADPPRSGAEVARTPAPDPELHQALTIGARCNTAEIREVPTGGTSVIGDPTEGALLVAAAKAGLSTSHPAEDILAKIPFDSDRKAMSVVARSDDGVPHAVYEGRPGSRARRQHGRVSQWLGRAAHARAPPADHAGQFGHGVARASRPRTRLSPATAPA